MPREGCLLARGGRASAAKAEDVAKRLKARINGKLRRIPYHQAIQSIADAMKRVCKFPPSPCEKVNL